MPQIELRLQSGTRSAGDIILTVQDKTFNYLLTSYAREIRVSGYLDRDWPQVEAKYEEIFVSDDCSFISKVTQVIPGSKTREKLTLPCAMEEGEQLTILLARTVIAK